MAKEKWGEDLPFTMTSIEGLMQNNPSDVPQLMMIINPGIQIFIVLLDGSIFKRIRPINLHALCSIFYE